LFLLLSLRPSPRSTLFPYATLFRSCGLTLRGIQPHAVEQRFRDANLVAGDAVVRLAQRPHRRERRFEQLRLNLREIADNQLRQRSEEHTSELQSRENLVCRPLPENK